MAMMHTRPMKHNINAGRRAVGNVKDTTARSYGGPTGFNPPNAVFIFDPVTTVRYTTQTGTIPGYAADPRYGRPVLKNALNTRTITD